MDEVKIQLVHLKTDSDTVLEALRAILSISYEKESITWDEIKERERPDFMKVTAALRLVIEKFSEFFPVDTREEIIRILLTGLHSTMPLEEGPKRNV